MKALMARPQPVPTLYVKTLSQRSYGPQMSVRQIFVKARQTAPCLLLFEDVDSMVTDQVRSYFLNEVDGLEENDGILMIGSTNNCMLYATLEPTKRTAADKWQWTSLTQASPSVPVASIGNTVLVILYLKTVFDTANIGGNAHDVSLPVGC
jgi:ATPase family associated with various cellular activities (AAA)